MIKVSSFCACWFKIKAPFKLKHTYFLQSTVKTMTYFIVLLLAFFSETAICTDEFKETFPVQSHSAQNALQLTAEEQQWLSQHKNIRIAYDGSLPPYSFVNDQGKIDGIAVEIMSALSQRLGIAFTVYPDSNWSSLYRAGAKRNVDIIATMVNRIDREEWFRFSKPYLTKSLVIVTKQENTTINDRNDIADKTVAVVKGYQYSEQVGKEFPTANRFKADTMLASLKAVEAGQAEAAILFLGTANYLQSKYGLTHLKIAAFYDRNSANESIAVRKDWPVLVEVLQKGLDSLTEEEVQKIFAKWVVQAGAAAVPTPDETAEKIQEKLTKKVVEIEQQLPEFGKHKEDLETPFGLIEISKIMGIALGVLLFYLLWLSLVRKHKKRKLQTKNNAKTPVRKAPSNHNDAKILIIEPTFDIDGEVKPEIQDNPFNLNIEHLRLGHETQFEIPTEETISYQRDGEGHFSFVSSAITSILGYSETDFMENHRNYLTTNPVNRHLDTYIEACMQGQPNEPYEIEIFDSGQDVHWLEVMDSPVYDGQGHCIGIEGIMRDVTAQRLYDKLSVKSDPESVEEESGSLTETLQDQLLRAIQAASVSHNPFVLIYLSLDRLRFLDGGVFGNVDYDVFNEAGKRLRATLRDTDSVVELDIDKYALILSETNDFAANLIIEKIKKILQVPYLIGVQSIVLDANIGSAVYPDHGDDPETLINKAKNFPSIDLVEPSSDKPMTTLDDSLLDEDNLQIQQDLVLALDECKVSLRASSSHNINVLHRHSQFSVHYQSRHSLDDFNIIGFEALIRWQHPELGLLLPKDFVALVKDIGLLDVMTYWIIQQVSFQAIAWEKRGIRPKLMAINLGDLTRKATIEVNKIISIVKEAGAQPEWLEFSIPESELANKQDLIVPIIEQLAEAGFTVAIDNFNADSTVMEMLKTIPAQIIEMDPAFVRHLPGNKDYADDITNSIAVLHELKKIVVAKEVETEAQLEFVRTTGCDAIQGHLLSRPLPAKEAKALLNNLPDFAWYLQQK
jgi:PAS domain S-box-containing protein